MRDRRILLLVTSFLATLATATASASDKLGTNQALYPGQSISSGAASLVYQSDDNLVLYYNGSAQWATMAGLGWSPGQFAMQGDCNAVVYASNGAVPWASGTNGRGSTCYAQVIDTGRGAGDWGICNGSSVVWSARGMLTCQTAIPRASTYMGCFTDDGNRALPAYQGGGFGWADCINQCRNAGYLFAGAQWYDQCFCGNDLGYSRVDDSECNTPCNYGGGTCGGGWRNSVYSTALNSNCSPDSSGHIQCCDSGYNPAGEQCQEIGPRLEDDQEALYTDCYGACGPGCSAINCGSGGACETHDYYTRVDGMFSLEAMAVFPDALIQWGACIAYTSVVFVVKTVISAFTKLAKGIGKALAKIFNE